MMAEMDRKATLAADDLVLASELIKTEKQQANALKKAKTNSQKKIDLELKNLKKEKEKNDERNEKNRRSLERKRGEEKEGKEGDRRGAKGEGSEEMKVTETLVLGTITDRDAPNLPSNPN
jgi:hypothetical protein